MTHTSYLQMWSCYSYGRMNTNADRCLSHFCSLNWCLRNTHCSHTLQVKTAVHPLCHMCQTQDPEGHTWLLYVVQENLELMAVRN